MDNQNLCAICNVVGYECMMRSDGIKFKITECSRLKIKNKTVNAKQPVIITREPKRRCTLDRYNTKPVETFTGLMF